MFTSDNLCVHYFGANYVLTSIYISMYFCILGLLCKGIEKNDCVGMRSTQFLPGFHISPEPKVCRRGEHNCVVSSSVFVC